MFLQKILHYLNPRNLFRRETSDINLRFMHGINKISIFMFVFCLIVLLVRWVAR
ncbi:MAG: DUF6728 family protein [Flavobacteriales bacterium]